jgi:hypothetical protein
LGVSTINNQGHAKRVSKSTDINIERKVYLEPFYSYFHIPLMFCVLQEIGIAEGFNHPLFTGGTLLETHAPAIDIKIIILHDGVWPMALGGERYGCIESLNSYHWVGYSHATVNH